MKHAAGAARPVLVGLVVLAISSYLTLILAGRILGAAQFSGIAALYALLTAVATGLFQPLEQEISRRRGREWETHSAERTLVVRAARVGLGLAAATIALALLLNRQAVGLLGHEPQLLAAFCVGLPGYALCFVVRGMLAGNRQLNRYGTQLAVEGTSRLLGLAVLASAGVSSSVAYGWLFAAAPWIAVAACLVGWRPGEQASQRAPAVPLLAPLSLLLISAPPDPLRHGGSGDLDPLTRTGVHALPGGAIRSRELAEPREVDVTAALQRVGDRVEEGVDCLLRFPVPEAAALRDRGDEFLLRHESSYLDCRGPGLPDPNNRLNHA